MIPGCSAGPNIPNVSSNLQIDPGDCRAYNHGICAEVERSIWPWISAGLISPVIGARLPMDEAAEAHRLLESGAVTGKILLTASR